MRLILLSVVISILGACAHVSSVSQTSIPKDRSKLVTAKVEKNIILLMNFDNNYLDVLTQKLIDQCPEGSVKGILTKDERITYFPIIFHKSVITASGYCVKSSKGRSKKRRKKRS